MPDFSVIIQDPNIRAIVQDGILERAFHDALFPKLLFRGEGMPQIWPANIGDRMVFTGVGLIGPKMKPLVPGTDPTPSVYQEEQWMATLQQYADSIDTQMPTSINAIANLFLRNAQQLGLSAGQSLNRLPRDRMYNAGMSGNTNAVGLGSSSTALTVARLNGFTTARNPNLTGGSTVAFNTVSAANPLAITVGGTAASVVGFTSVNPGDETGPGTLTLAVAKSWSDRDAVISADASQVVNVGGATSIDGISSSNVLTLAAIRTAVAQFWQNNVPEFTDGRFHCHLDPTSQAQIFGDNEFQRLLTALPDYYMYKQFALGELLGCVFFRNSECPLPETVQTATGALPYTYSPEDPFGGELANTHSLVIHRALFTGQGLMYEYYQDLGQLITEAGVTGRVGEPKITNNGIEVNTDRIQLIIRSPLNRLQDLVSTSWKFIGDWPVRTDALSGGTARYKRAVVIQHGA